MDNGAFHATSEGSTIKDDSLDTNTLLTDMSPFVSQTEEAEGCSASSDGSGRCGQIFLMYKQTQPAVQPVAIRT